MTFAGHRSADARRKVLGLHKNLVRTQNALGKSADIEPVVAPEPFVAESEVQVESIDVAYQPVQRALGTGVHSGAAEMMLRDWEE